MERKFWVGGCQSKIFLDALRPCGPRIATDNLRIQTWILRLSPEEFFSVAKITSESISENELRLCHVITNVKCQNT